MEDLAGRVAVVTGGASGIGYAMAERFLAEGMSVMLADVEEAALKDALATLGEAASAAANGSPSPHAANGSAAPQATNGSPPGQAANGSVAPETATISQPKSVRCDGVRCDVRKWEDVAALRDAALDRFGKVHVVCNNAGVGSGSHGWMWEYDLNDWTWAMGVNVMGVVHGINAFVPEILSHGEGGHIVNTSSGNGGLSPLPGTPIYAASKGAVTLITECLQAQLIQASENVRASVLYPGPNWLNTKIWSSHRNRPEELAQDNPRTQWTTFEDLEKMFKDSGQPFETTPLEEVAMRVVDGIRTQQFWMLADSEKADSMIKLRSQSMLARSNPDYFGDWKPPVSVSSAE